MIQNALGRRPDAQRETRFCSRCSYGRQVDPGSWLNRNGQLCFLAWIGRWRHHDRDRVRIRRAHRRQIIRRRDSTLFASNWVVVVASVPHRLPPHPLPERLHVRFALGFEPGIGVSVATIVADALGATLPGPVTCNAKLLVTLKLAIANLDGPATLCARTTTECELGKICGAV